MSRHLRKSVYLCRAPWCKQKNIVWEWVDADVADDNLIETAPAWQHRCGKCGRGSLDLTYQNVCKPEPLKISPSALRDERRSQGNHPTIKEYEDVQEH